MPRDDDREEFGDEIQSPIPQDANLQGQPGMAATCAFCNLRARIPAPCFREDGTASCPQCGADLVFPPEIQQEELPTVDLTLTWRPGMTGRCNVCQLVARCFEDVRREDGRAGCEMCGQGVFEFMAGLSPTQFRAPAPRAEYDHVIEGMTIKLPRRVSVEMLTAVLGELRGGRDILEVINDPNHIRRFNTEGFTARIVDQVKKAENLRRWDVQEPLLYSQSEKARLAGFIMLRVPFPSRIKIRFAGIHGHIDRWVTQQTFNEIQNASRTLIFDGKYKAPESARMGEEPRFEIARRMFSKCNALLGRGLLRAWTAGGEEIPLGNSNQEVWSGPEQPRGSNPTNIFGDDEERDEDERRFLRGGDPGPTGPSDPEPPSTPDNPESPNSGPDTNS